MSLEFPSCVPACPQCGGAVHAPRLSSHPVGEMLRDASFALVVAGFLMGIFMVLFGGILIGEYERGYVAFIITMTPSLFVLCISFLFPRVWVTHCGHCRLSWFRRRVAGAWRPA